MKQDFEKSTQLMCLENYEPPRIEVIEMEIEGPILQMSGEDSNLQNW